VESAPFVFHVRPHGYFLTAAIPHRMVLEQARNFVLHFKSAGYVAAYPNQISTNR
jgi:hypothetical protein